MKTTILIIGSILSLSLSGQPDHYIVNEEGLWSTLIIHCLPGGNNYNTYFSKFQGDTMIDGYNYKKIWRCDEEDLTNWEFDGFIRENEDHQVFLKPADYIEGLIYDFEVNVGDSIQALNVYINSSDPLNFIVTQVDSVLMLDRYRKRIILFEYINQKEEVWIEGLGSYFGILNSCNDAYGFTCGDVEALCYTEDDHLVFQSPEYETCYLSVTVGLHPYNIQNLKVFPNPTRNFVNISFPDDQKRWIEILDLSGKKVAKNLFFEKNILLHLHEVDNGIYIINAFDEQSYYPPYKLIVD